MSWTSAYAQLVVIHEGTSPTTKKAATPAKFKHKPEASRIQLPGDSRVFFFEIEKIAMKGQITVGLPRWQRAMIHSLVFYAEETDQKTLLEIMAADHLALLTQLGDQSKWNQPTSTIESLFLGGDLLGETKIDRVEGGRLMDIAFEMEWNNV